MCLVSSVTISHSNAHDIFADGRYGTALQAAAYQKHSKMIEMLLDQKADINLQGSIIIHIGGYSHVSH
jgi:hypothetical protein